MIQFPGVFASIVCTLLVCIVGRLGRTVVAGFLSVVVIVLPRSFLRRTVCVLPCVVRLPILELGSIMIIGFRLYLRIVLRALRSTVWTSLV